MPTLPFRPLASVLIQRTVVLGVLCMLVVLSVQAVVRFHEQHERFAQLVNDIAQTSVPLLSVSLWDIEPKAIQLQVDLLAQRPEIGYVRLIAGTGQRFAAGQARLGDAPVTRQLQIPYPHGTGEIGKLEIIGNSDFFYRTVLADTWTLLLGYGAFTLLVCALIAFMLRRELQTPLERIARFAAELKPQQLMTPLELNRPSRAQLDEIDLVADGFRKLQGGLQDHIANLDRLVAERTSQLELVMDELRQLTLTDTLTGCFNRRAIEARLPSEVERAQRYNRPLSVVFTDLDYFKNINDRHGHPAGDAVLRTIAQLYQSEMRSSVDWIARYGGEEFLIVLPETDLQAARVIAERLRLLTQAALVHGEGQDIRLTASFGVAQCHANENSMGLLARADAMLYAAKAQGRNRVLALV
ncbi:MAG TPA: diguanylate cyclase [Burkholderiaceae bacterium]|nr:diguanylate cyclase [Burkholderiaceae bacterium]